MISKILSYLLWFAAYVVSLLPLKVLYIFTDIIFWMGYYIIGYRRFIIVQNLSRSFPQMKYREIALTTNGFTHHFFNLFAEWLKLVSESKRSLKKRVKFTNIELLNSCNQQGKNVILVMGHYGNWEYLNILPFFTDQPVYALYKKISNKVIDTTGGWMRKRFGVNMLESKEASKFILKNRNNPSIYIMISDQSPAANTKETFSFMNQPTRAFAGVEKLAKAIDATVMYTEIMPVKRGYYNITFSQIDINGDITQQFLNSLEVTINKSPKYWLWSHRRWKHIID